MPHHHSCVRWEGVVLRNMLVSRLGDEAGAVDVSPAAGMGAGHEEPSSTGNTRAQVGGREERAYSKPSGKLVTSMISCARCARKTTSRLNRGDELRAAAAQIIPKTSTAFSMGTATGGRGTRVSDRL